MPPLDDPFATPALDDPFAEGSDPFAAADVPTLQPSHWGDYAGMALRGLSGFLATEGGPLGALISGAGDLGAQTLERVGGSRSHYNLGESAVAAGAGAIPFGREASLLRGLLKGSAVSGGASALTDVATQLGDTTPGGVDLGEVARAGRTGAVLGAAGAGAGALVQKLLRGGLGRAATSEREALRALAKEPPTVAPRSFPTPEEVRSSVLGAPSEAPVPLGPITSREQFEGIDPSRIGRGATQEPLLRAPNRIVDTGGPIAGELDPFAPTPREPLLRSENRIAPGGPDEGIEPFTVGAPGEDLAQVGAQDRASNQQFVQRFLQSLGINPEAVAAHAAAPIDAGATEAAAGAAPTTARQFVETGIENARRRGVPFIPSELVTTFRGLLPKWQRTLEQTGSDMRESLPFFGRRVLSAENPRKLMGAERKALAAAKAAGKEIYAGEPALAPGHTPQPVPRPDTVQTNGFPGGPTKVATAAAATGATDPEAQSLADMVQRLYEDESGSIDPELARKLAVHGGSALAGAAIGGATSDDRHRLRNTIGGALVGGALPAAFRQGSSAAELLNKYRYFSLLSSTGAQAKNVVGNAGATLTRAAEEYLTGNKDTARSILSSVFSRDTADRFIEAFKEPPVDDTRWGKNSGVLGAFSRVMHAVDQAATEGLERGGLSHDEARLSLFTSEPRSKVGKYLSSRPEGPLSLAIPFVRTASNVLERGLEHTPGIGMLPAVRAMRGDSLDRVLARQAIGALAVGGGALAGSINPLVGAALGPLALPAALGSSARTAYDKSQRAGSRSDLLTNFANAEMDTLRRALPLPTDAYNYTPGQILASFVPSILRDASLVDPREFEQTSLFDPAIAKVPYLNAVLLRRKPRTRRRMAR